MQATPKPGTTGHEAEPTFEIRSLLELGDTTFVVTQQQSGGAFILGDGALLGGVPITPEVELPRTSQVHEEVNPGIFVFTLRYRADAAHLAVGQIVALCSGSLPSQQSPLQ